MADEFDFLEFLMSFIIQYADGTRYISHKNKLHKRDKLTGNILDVGETGNPC